MKRIAVFDIDGTLLPGSSAERILLRYLVERGELGPFAFARATGHFLARFAWSWTEATRGNKAYLRGLRRDRLEELIESCFAERILPMLSERGREILEEQRATGREIVLLSGTLDPLMALFRSHYAADHVHSARLAVENGAYTGRTEGVHPFGPVKSHIIREHYPAGIYDLSESSAYADHAGDLEFLALFGHPRLVNPGQRARRLAAGRAMKILSF